MATGRDCNKEMLDSLNDLIKERDSLGTELAQSKKQNAHLQDLHTELTKELEHMFTVHSLRDCVNPEGATQVFLDFDEVQALENSLCDMVQDLHDGLDHPLYKWLFMAYFEKSTGTIESQSEELEDEGEEDEDDEDTGFEKRESDDDADDGDDDDEGAAPAKESPPKDAEPEQEKKDPPPKAEHYEHRVKSFNDKGGEPTSKKKVHGHDTLSPRLSEVLEVNDRQLALEQQIAH